MKATGIVRRIDDLGRVVIPKEIRRVLRFKEGEPLEIFTDENGEVIFKKFSMISEMSEFSESFAECITKVLSIQSAVIDTDKIVAATGNGKKEVTGKRINHELSSILEQRNTVVADPANNSRYWLTDDGYAFNCIAAVPVLSNGDYMGAVALISADQDKKAGSAEIKVLEFAGEFYGRLLED